MIPQSRKILMIRLGINILNLNSGKFKKEEYLCNKLYRNIYRGDKISLKPYINDSVDWNKESNISCLILISVFVDARLASLHFFYKSDSLILKCGITLKTHMRNSFQQVIFPQTSNVSHYYISK